MKTKLGIHFDKKSAKDIVIKPMNILLGAIYALIFLYRINYLKGEEVSDFNRTFSPSLLAGIDYNSRIQGTYLFYFLIFPALTILLAWLIGLFFEKKESKYHALQTVTFISIAAVIVAYFAKYTDASASDINENSILLLLTTFAISLLVISIIDIRDLITEENIYKFFISNAMCILALKQYMIQTEKGIRKVFSFVILNSHILVPVIFTALVIIIISVPRFRTSIKTFFDSLLLLSWIPFFTRLAIEITYTKIGLGGGSYNIRKITLVVSLLLAVAILAGAVFIAYKNVTVDFSQAGYLGTLLSLAALVSFTGYQQVISLGSNANIYELGNHSAAMDSLWYGKLPIVDYFSAHALGDAIPQLISAALNKENLFLYTSSSWNFIFTGLSFVFFYMIIREYLGNPLSIIFLMLFPCSVGGVFITTFCFLPVAASITLIRRKSLKYYFICKT